jgi:hypothetical protein
MQQFTVTSGSSRLKIDRNVRVQPAQFVHQTGLDSLVACGARSRDEPNAEGL